ncbi:hypothetical protein ACLKMH_01505 [Psychromonas sp. KJ10-10]|uniref:hypothetical protein n=1 Tax=Psychromonas sp. KJ10-10 TaxID=3391823 RepID=UPI0039B54FB5
MKQRSTDASFDRAMEKLKRTQQATDTPLFMAKGSVDSLITENMQTQLQAFSQLVINGWQGKEINTLYILINIQQLRWFFIKPIARHVVANLWMQIQVIL